MKTLAITLVTLVGMVAMAGPSTIVCGGRDNTKVIINSPDGNDTDYRTKHQVLIELDGTSSNYLYNLNLDGKLPKADGTAESGTQYEAGAEAADYPVVFFHQQENVAPPFPATLIIKGSGNRTVKSVKLECSFN